jgi:hypothetical protein
MSLLQLPPDVTCRILICLSSVDLQHLASVTKSITHDEHLWFVFAFRYWSTEFWKYASRRDVVVSKPLPKWRLQVGRLLRFEDSMRRHLATSEYINLWRMYDKCAARHYWRALENHWMHGRYCENRDKLLEVTSWRTLCRAPLGRA